MKNFRKMSKKDISKVTTLAMELWPDNIENELYDEFLDEYSSENSEIFVFDEDGLRAFCHCALRFDYVEGCTNTPTGYLEGIYVENNYRNKGIANQLIELSIEWSREKGCMEFASDVELNNVSSQEFHEAIGFSETNRLVTYIKKI